MSVVIISLQYRKQTMPPSNTLKQLWQASSVSFTPRTAIPKSFRPAQRFLATHSQHQPNLDASSSKESAEEMLKRLEAEMRGKAQPAGSSGGTRLGSDGRGNVGPFPMGNGGRDKTWKKWRDLNIAGKLGRTTRQTGNLTVVILGGGLFVVLTIALTTELFAKNSPSVLYSQAVDMIRESDALNPHLLPPLAFTHSPSSSAPSRGSTPLASQLLRHPTSGRDHLILRFYVHGRGKDEAEPLGYLKQSLHTAEEWALWALESVGIDLNAKSEEPAVEEKVDAAKSSESEGSGWLKSAFGSFSSLRTPAGSPVQQGKQRGLPPPGTYKSGEVTADYVKNAAGTYTLVTLAIDIPHSKAAHPQRAVIYRSPEANVEGLLGGRYR